MIFSLINYLRCVIFYMSIFATRLPICMFFSLFSTHFKWSKPGLKQNCEASLSPINQDFLESCQCTAVAYKQYFYHFLLSPHKSYFSSQTPCFQGFSSSGKPLIFQISSHFFLYFLMLFSAIYVKTYAKQFAYIRPFLGFCHSSQFLFCIIKINMSISI